jgi:hypothetical protein
MIGKKENRGGSRKGAGRPKINKKTKVLTFRVPSEKEGTLKILIKNLIKNKNI